MVAGFIRVATASALLVAAGLSAGCHSQNLRKVAHLLPDQRSRYVVPLPAGFPLPLVPGDNALTAEKVALGRRLFYDKRLSLNETYSCGSCHQQSKAFTDGRTHAVGSTGAEHYRNTMSLINAVYSPAYTWADPSVRTFEEQLLVPLTNVHPVELGFAGRLPELERRLRSDVRYRELFARSFPSDDEPVTVGNVARAIASFERTIISGRSPFDRMLHDGDVEAMSPAALRGMRVFLSARAACSTCHSGFDFCGNVTTAESPPKPAAFRNTGTWDGQSSDSGLASVTHRNAGLGRFRIPTLRNIAVTGPYMHDGRFATLDEVIDHYAAGGPPRPGQKLDIKPFLITPTEKRDLIEFLNSLTDREVLTDGRLGEAGSG
ncbi:MAG: MbnH family di-heme enzyme [Acidobacteriota bacterium]